MPTHRIILITKGNAPQTVDTAESEAEAELKLATFQAYKVEGEAYVIEQIEPGQQC